MKKKCTIETNIRLMPRGGEGKYMVQIVYCQGGITFTANNGGIGYTLQEAQGIAFTMRDHIKSDE
jgi:hypothetical protein